MMTVRVHRALLRVPLPVLLVLGAVVGCSGEDEPQEDPGVSASRICDGLLDKAGAHALVRLSGYDHFTETDDDNKFSLAKAVRPEAMNKSGAEHSQCTLWSVGDIYDSPVIDLDFNMLDKATGLDDGLQDSVRYPVGAYAATTGMWLSKVVFNCPLKDGDKTVPYVSVSMGTIPIQLRGEHKSGDRITILTAAARSAAAQLHCEDTAKLPAHMPPPTA